MRAAVERGKRGGLARAMALDAGARSAAARTAARARWLRGKTRLDHDPAAIERFCDKWDITEVAVFGSAARGDMRPNSDVDVIVDGDLSHFNIGRFCEMRSDLESIFKRPVDLFTKDGVSRWRNEILRHRVLTERVVIRAAS